MGVNLLHEYQKTVLDLRNLELDYFLISDLVDQVFGNPRMSEKMRKEKHIYDNDLTMGDIDMAIENLMKLREEIKHEEQFP